MHFTGQKTFRSLFDLCKLTATMTFQLYFVLRKKMFSKFRTKNEFELRKLRGEKEFATHSELSAEITDSKRHLKL